MTDTGHLFLVIGPSGAGKDTLIDAARQVFSREPRIAFPRRSITRPPDGSEDNDHVPAAAFAEAVQAGAFFLHWSAHGHDYGLPVSVHHDLRQAKAVVCNVSRQVFDAPALTPAALPAGTGITVLEVWARPDVLAGRLAARGRETRAQIEQRLAHVQPFALPAHMTHVRVDNSGALETAVAAFIAPICAALHIEPPRAFSSEADLRSGPGKRAKTTSESG